jgi:hypothetical protein
MTVASPPGAPEQKKKGLSTLAWILIGCGGLILVAGVVVTVVIGYGVSKAKDFVQEAEKNPVTMIGKTYAAVNPDVEFVSADENSREIVFRDVKTGETVTISADEIQDGKLKVKTKDGEMTFDAQGGEQGAMTVTDASGRTVLKAGPGSISDLPDWVPVYPGAEVTSTYSAEAAGTGQGSGGAFSLSTDDSVDTVFDHYRKALADGGFEIQLMTPSGTTKMIIASHSDPTRNVTVSITEADGKTQAAVQYASE